MSENMTPISGGNSWNSRLPKIGALVVLAGVVVIILWRIVSASNKQVLPKTKAQLELEQLKKKTNDTAKVIGSQDHGENLNAKGSDQPTGDSKAIAVLQEARLKDEDATKKLKEAEDAAQAQAEYTHYSRMLQRMPHDPAMAAAWQRRVAEASMSGQAPPSPPPAISREAAEILKSKNPALLAKANGGVSSQGSQSGAPNVKIAQGSAAPSNLPPNVDPKTGLPIGAVTVGAAPQELGGSSIYAVGPDGMPDLEGGAVPVTFQFIPPGESQPRTVTRWVRPEFLTSRGIPYDPKDLVMVNQAYWSSLRAPTDIPEDKAALAIRIPATVQSNRSRATGAANFTATNNYVVVVPNPKGRLSPPNPPAKR